jgi:heme oxygenase
MDIAQDASVLGSLRRATAARHRALEALPTLSLPLRLEGYVQALQGFELLLSVWEPRVQAALPPRLRGWLAPRSRYALLRQDLDRLGRAPLDGMLAERCAVHARRIGLDGIAAAFGSMYVLEGSALGGQVIARAARDCVEIGAQGAMYFAGAGSATASHWREFLSLLETEIATDAPSLGDASKAAQQTFDALIGIFTELRDASAAG